MTSMYTSLRFKDNRPIDIDLLRNYFPSVLQGVKHPDRSERYQHIHTLDAVKTLSKEGWDVYSVRTAHTRKVSMIPYATHEIRLRREDTKPRQVDGSVPEIVLMNSHNATRRLKIAGGVFTFICLNGAMVGSLAASYAFLHTEKDLMNKTVEAVEHVARSLDGLMDRFAAWQGRILTADEVRKLVMIAYKLRYGEEGFERLVQSGATNLNAMAAQMLIVRRREDEGIDAWRVYNRLQESVIRGGFSFLNERGNFRRARHITNIQADNAMNAKLLEAVDEIVG
jgi:hypothetical protein